MADVSLDDRIVQTPDTRSGKPRIAGHRITVSDIAVWHTEAGMSAEEIATQYRLDLVDVHAALAYYFANQEEIEQEITDSEALIEELREKYSSPPDSGEREEK